MTNTRPQKSAGDRDGGGHGAKTDAVRERAVLALMTEKTVAEAARKSGVNEKTLRRWLAEDELFKGEYVEARQAAFQMGMGRVQAMTLRAVETLGELLEARQHPNVRLGAARTIVELANHQQDAETILRKLEELEYFREGRKQDLKAPCRA